MATGDKLKAAAAALHVEEVEGDHGGLALGTGSTLLNLACTGDVDRGFLAGKYYLLVGDPSAGKTFIAMASLAEATIDPEFKNYRLIYDNIEDGCLLDIQRLFGGALLKRLESPGFGPDGAPAYSSTVEEFYANLDDALNGSRPVVYILDSMDGLTSSEEEGQFEKEKKALRKGTDVSGSYGMSKPKLNSTHLRPIIKKLRSTGSILVILSQTRDKLGFGFEKKTRSGGHSLRFYATGEMWASIVGTIKKVVNDKPRQIGVSVKWKVKKNRVTGALREAHFDIYPSVGIDDVGSCVDFLVSEGVWTKTGSKISAELDNANFVFGREKLIAKIEELGKVAALKELVQKCWDDIERKSRVERKNRYSSMDTD